jgi:hypothetical protein
MKKQILYGFLFILLLPIFVLMINPRLGSYTIKADVCPVENPDERPLRLIMGETLQKVKAEDKPSNNPLLGCRIEVKYVQYLR